MQTTVIHPGWSVYRGDFLLHPLCDESLFSFFSLHKRCLMRVAITAKPCTLLIFPISGAAASQVPSLEKLVN